MPKKTRKEKIIARYRRQIKILQQSQVIPTTPKKTDTFATEGSQVLPVNQKASSNLTSILPKSDLTTEDAAEEKVQLKKFFMEDFRKSLFLSGLIIGFELILFFAKIIK
ncbi:MAG: hypothetical protein ACPL1D_00565 [Microgenomates group bacterium]